MTLAKRIDQTVKEWDPYGYRDSECSVEYFEDLLKNSPETIINGLLDQIDDMYESLQDMENIISKIK